MQTNENGREKEKKNERYKLTIKFKMPTSFRVQHKKNRLKKDCSHEERIETYWNFNKNVYNRHNADTQTMNTRSECDMVTCDECQVSLNGPPAIISIKRAQIDLFYADNFTFYSISERL